jgi:hypothetical protein
MNDAKQIERDLLRELKARGVKLADLKKRQVRDVAGDAALVERLRDQINQGAALDIDAFMKLKASATASRLELFDGLLPTDRVDRIEVELIPAPSQYRKLEEENAGLKARLQALESNSPNGTQTATVVPPNLPDPTLPPAAPSAPPSNVVPLVETREQRIARLRHEAGDRPQTLRTAFELDHFPREGGGRFDFPTNRGGW